MLDWKLLGTTFVAIFVAEMGDKTQLATLGMATGTSRWSVFIGAALALVATSAIAVLIGDAVSRHLSPIWVRRGAGVLFLVLGTVYLATKPQ
jgi:putative Ca2+/H+ antiporter (TMEM165/GDT1 family)